MIKFFYVLYYLKLFDDNDVLQDMFNVENCLSERQKYNGQWKNLSETAEVALALLYREEYGIRVHRTNAFDTMINRAINYIQNEFNYEKSCWLEDENSTAKSLNVILHYDEIFNFAFDDFLVDLLSNTNKYSQAVNISNNIKALDFAQEQNNTLQVKMEEKDDQIRDFTSGIRYSGILIMKYKFLVGLLASAFAPL